ncbi:sugar ABC transporter ATP-binding protein [Morganella morganii]|uniref:sugar ABC transporter ATP-binding protein n=1 Tax=Morganella morganii TaxID=582 RepID=UPI001164C4AA|nr:sugar ABC transporter ATP-binding protein [Morganella morganii]EMD6372020.1 sugar ABC transporter ATP-binding protein [Morganella morganii]MBC4011918.1 sugar ABC transporter ATP-binding protein [Morganella morganii]MBS5192191.1 sugar ABC transporter ATP-binding protein [Morganella morganii]MBT0384488.1 sugar ABC transporter ATP-binding protein [Morganella morganii subsp. morganii]QQO71784.1 sugar ABC transporter ATP-binding protein [Morganella morganii]
MTATVADNEELLRVEGVRKAFGQVVALKNAQFSLKRGSIHALCGGNGAGKSTFLSILMGFIRPDAGEIYVKGKRCEFHQPIEALHAGIAIVQQELSSIPDLTVAENIWLGREPRRFGFVDFKQLNRQTAELLTDLHFDISPSEKMRNLSVAEQQLVEIAKALSHADADIIIMDEPTSAIGEEDAQKIFDVITRLTEKGKGIIYVSHRLSEIFQIADTFTIFRDGTFITDGPLADITREKLIELIIGREIKDEFAKFNEPTDETIMEVRDLSRDDQVQDISLTLKKGEILGIYGLVGSGRSEFLDLIFGIEHADKGTIKIGDRFLDKHTPKDSINAGIAYVTEDRKDTGLMLGRSINENINIASFGAISTGGFIHDRKERARADDMITLFNVKTPDADQLVGNLSGGNQQKVVLGRWALIEPDVMLLDEPTRGVDVGAKKEIYKFMSEFALQGKGIVMVSSELSEIIGMSDRIIVFRDGRIAGELTAATATQTDLMKLAV